MNTSCHAECPGGVSGGRQSVSFTDGQFRGKSVVTGVPVTPLQTLVGKDKEWPSSTEGFVMLPGGCWCSSDINRGSWLPQCMSKAVSGKSDNTRKPYAHRPLFAFYSALGLSY